MNQLIVVVRFIRLLLPQSRERRKVQDKCTKPDNTSSPRSRRLDGSDQEVVVADVAQRQSRPKLLDVVVSSNLTLGTLHKLRGCCEVDHSNPTEQSNHGA